MKGKGQFFKAILDNLYDGVYFVDRQREITYWNNGAERITGYSTGKIVGRRCYDDLLGHVDDRGVRLCHGDCPLAATIEDGEVREAQVYLRHAKGHRVPVLVRVSPLHDAHGQISGAVEVFSDNSHLLATLDRLIELEALALEDSLTGIGNRRFLEARLHASIHEYCNTGRSFAVLFIDVDHFKEVNDRYGHTAGDLLLQALARTLRYNLRIGDLVGRWGGEEFVALIYDAADKDAVYQVANKLRVLVENTCLQIDGGMVKTTVSIGGALVEPHDFPAALIERADHLCYKSKIAGRNCVNV